MSAYLSRLKNAYSDNFIKTPYIEPTKPTKGAFDGFVGSPIEHIKKNNCSIDVTSNWWLITFTGLEPMQIAIWPPANHDEVISLNQNAILAIPMQSPLMQTVVIDTPQNMLCLMHLGGFGIRLIGDDLHIEQTHWIDDDLAGLIKTHKIGLIKILESEAMIFTGKI